MADKIEFLRQHPLFQRFSDADIHALSRISEELEFVENGIIAYQGDVADALILVKSGYVYAEQRRFDSEENEFVRDSVRFLPNEYLGDLWLFEPAAQTHTLRAHAHDGEPPRIIVIRSHNFLHLLSGNPALVPKCAPVADRHGRVIGGFRPTAWADARKMMAKADRKSSAVSILPDELVEYNSRRSYWFLFVRLFGPVLGLLTIPLLLFLFFNIQTNFLISLRYPVPGLFAFILLVWVGFRLLDWSNDYFVITNKRLVHREFDLRSFRVDIKTARIDQVQSVEIAQPTFISNLFNFGTARVTTASQFGVILFDNIDDPAEVQQTLDRLRKMVRQVDAGRDQTLMRESLQNHFQIQDNYDTIGDTAIDSGPLNYRREETFWDRLRSRYAWRVEDAQTITYRKHGLVLVIEAIIPITLGFIGVIGSYLLISQLAFTFAGLLPWLALYYGFVTIWLIWRVEDWRNDIFQLTQNAIIDIDRLPFGFGESSKKALLTNIQNVNAYTPGLLHTIFNYGNVDIETAGGEDNIEFENVPHPSTVQSDIFQKLSEFQDQKRRRETAQRHKEYSLLLDVYKQTQEQELLPRRTPLRETPPDPPSPSPLNNG